jgi:hypothetical protein
MNEIRAGKPADEVRAWFNPNEDKFFTPQEAVAVGLVDVF